MTSEQKLKANESLAAIHAKLDETQTMVCQCACDLIMAREFTMGRQLVDQAISINVTRAYFLNVKYTAQQKFQT